MNETTLSPERAPYPSVKKPAPGAKRQVISAKEMHRRERLALEKKGIYQEQVRADDLSQPTVLVRGATLRRRGLDVYHVEAAERFGLDYELAEFSGLKCKGFEPGVDGSKSHEVHLAQQDARIRCSAVKEAIGERNYQIVCGVVLGFSARVIHAAGGEQHRTVNSDIRIAFDALSNFYAGKRRKDRTLVAFEGLIAEYFRVAEANLNGLEPGTDMLVAAARRYAETKNKKKKPVRHTETKFTTRAEDLNAEHLALGVVDRLVSWERLNLVQIDSFKLSKENERHGITAYATRNGKEMAQTVFVSGPYLRAVIDAQLLKAALRMKWKERT